MNPRPCIGAVSHTRACGGKLVAVLLGSLALLGACRSQGAGGATRGASADPIAAADASARKDWRDAADRWYAVYLADQGQHVKPIVETARALLMSKDWENANNMIDLGLRDHPDDIDAIEVKADILVAMGFRRPAERYYQRVVESQPQRTSALLSIGRTRVELGLDAAAVAPLQEYVRLHGGNFESYGLLARAMNGAGDPSGAFVAWTKAFDYPGATAEDILTASALCLNADVVRTHPNAPAVCRGWLEKAIALDPQCTPAHFQLGVISEGAHAYDEAIEHYRRAVETDPSCLMALTNLAVLYSGRTDEPKTREMVQRALQLETDTDRRRALLKLLDPFEKKPEEKP